MKLTLILIISLAFTASSRADSYILAPFRTYIEFADSLIIADYVEPTGAMVTVTYKGSSYVTDRTYSVVKLRFHEAIGAFEDYKIISDDSITVSEERRGQGDRKIGIISKNFDMEFGTVFVSEGESFVEVLVEKRSLEQIDFADSSLWVLQKSVAFPHCLAYCIPNRIEDSRSLVSQSRGKTENQSTQDGADKTATAPESEPDGDGNPKPESEVPSR